MSKASVTIKLGAAQALRDHDVIISNNKGDLLFKHWNKDRGTIEAIKTVFKRNARGLNTDLDRLGRGMAG